MYVETCTFKNFNQQFKVLSIHLKIRSDLFPQPKVTPVLSREAEEKLRRLEQEHAKMAAIHSLTEVGVSMDGLTVLLLISLSNVSLLPVSSAMC